MASLGHIVVGMTAARAYRSGPPFDGALGRPAVAAMTAWSILSLLPDADVIGFPLGVQYGDEWGHRGATHSIAFALGLALVIGLAARFWRLPAWRTGLIAAAVLVSHGLLDTLTDGGLGSALFWPFDLTRYFAPWQPIPVAPIGLDFFSFGGLVVSLVEAVFFAPLLWLALRGVTRPPAVTIAAWCAAVFLVSWRGEARDNTLGFFLREDVRFASNYSEDRFRSIAPGQSEDDVTAKVGSPLSETWLYLPADRDPEQMAASELDKLRGCVSIDLLDGYVKSAVPEADCRGQGVDAGLPRSEVRRTLGSPPRGCWAFTNSPSGTAYRARIVCFKSGVVQVAIARWLPPGEQGP